MRLQFIACLLVISCCFTACNNTPDHAKYIPKDAEVVLGLNTEALGKKIAWNAFWGSKLMDEMKKNLDRKDMMKDMDKSGIKVMTTYYAYMKTDKRYDNSKKITAIIPLDDATKWEAYLKSISPEVVIKTQKDRKEVLLGNDVYASWNKDLLIVMNTIYQPMADPYTDIDYTDTAAMAKAEELLKNGKKADEPATALEMEKAFTTSSENAVTSNKTFLALQKAGHDISIWINYESLSNDYMTSGMTGGLALSNTLWKDAAMTVGFDFKKGSIEGDMHYCISDEMKEVCKDLGKENTDKEMVDRLPMDKLNLIAGWHISPTGTKKMLDMLGVIGFLNTGLSQIGLTADDLFNSFSGDMGLSLNNFSMVRKTVPANSLYPGQEEFTTTNSDIDYTFAVKIGQKASFDKLINYAVKEQIIQPSGDNNYMILKGSDTIRLNLSNNYMVVANSAKNTQAFVNGTNKPGDISKIIYKHPMGMYIDVKSMFNDLNPSVSGDDSTMIHVTRNLLSDITFYGGENKGNIFDYHLSVNFINKDENSLIQLINYAGKMQEASKGREVAINK